MQRRRPPSGYHWCHKGFRETNPDEIQLDDELVYGGESEVRTTNTQLAEADHNRDKDILNTLISPLRKPLSSNSVGDVLTNDPEYLNELEGDEHGDLAAEYYEEEEEGDGLGYYPDGVKRTLTDEQIAIFRHSEEQQIERERRRAREQKIDDNARDQQMQDRQIDIVEAADGTTTKPTHETTSDPMQERTSTPEQQTTSNSTQEEVPYDQRHKRKWESYIERVDPVQGSMTRRRLARELDEQKATSIDIDYGGDQITAASPLRQPPTASDRRVLSYEDD